MKQTSTALFAGFALAGLLLTGPVRLRAQDKPSPLADKIASKHFVFKAQTVNPTSGRFRQLTGSYDLKVSGDSAIAYLPYFGRAYSAPINPAEGGINFTSVDFTYKSAARKKGWDVSIRPKDASGVQEMTLTIFENGNATLRVSSTNRQPISFNGYIDK